MVQSVQRAARILRELASGSPHLGVTDLADRLGMAKPTVHALLRTLEAESLVTQDRVTGRYLLGPGLLHLGNAYLGTQQLRTRSVSWAALLASQCGEAVWVGTLDHDRVLVLHHAFRPVGSTQILEVGTAVPWNTSALGKAMVAFLEPDAQEQLLAGELPVLTGVSVTDPAELSAQLARVRECGYALEDQECTLGEAGIAAPVFDGSATVVGALGIVGPVERLLTGPDTDEHRIRVREAARGLSRDLGATRLPLPAQGQRG